MNWHFGLHKITNKEIAMIIFFNKTEVKLDRKILSFLNEIKKSITPSEVELIIVNKDEIRKLNKEFLNKDYETDVLSFPLDFNGINIKNPPLGSIVISIDSALQTTKKLNHSLKDEISILFTHALLHLLGFNHEVDNGEHRIKEREILDSFGIKNPLIDRTFK